MFAACDRIVLVSAAVVRLRPATAVGIPILQLAQSLQEGIAPHWLVVVPVSKRRMVSLLTL